MAKAMMDKKKAAADKSKMTTPATKAKKTSTKKIKTNEELKYEIADELGLMNKINKKGWKSLTPQESGKIGGLMNSKRLADEAKAKKKAAKKAGM